jgi:hypothetical protein
MLQYLPGFYLSSVAALYAAAGGALFGDGTAGGTLLGSEPDGMAIDFTAATPDMLIRDNTAVLNYSGTPFAEGGVSGDAGKLSFTRASLAMKYNSSGVLEFSGHNLCLRSGALTIAPWSSARTTVTANTGDTTAPDGTSTAIKVLETTDNNTHYAAAQGPITVLIGNVVRYSFYAKGGLGRDWVLLDAYDGSSHLTWFDITNGVVGTNGAGNTASIESVGNGWYRCTVTRTVASAGAFIQLQTASADNVQSYIGDVTKGAYYWGGQVTNLPCSDTNYYPTVASAVYTHRIDYNPATLAARGLLVEEARTNLALRSQDTNNATWVFSGGAKTYDTDTAPDGTTTADKFTHTGGAGNVNQVGITTANSAYTWSIYLKKKVLNDWIAVNAFDGSTHETWFNLTTVAVGTNAAGSTSSIEDVGNGWCRIKITRTAAVSANSGIGISSADSDGDAEPASTAAFLSWGFQLELGSFATSYIPTTSASVTRAADAPSGSIEMALTQIPFSTTAGTIQVEMMHGQAGGAFPTANFPSFGVLGFSDAPATNELFFIYFEVALRGFRFNVNDGGVQQAQLNMSDPAVLTATKIAGAWAANDIASVQDGGTVQTDASATLPTPTTLLLGKSYTGGPTMQSAWIRKVLYIPLRKSDANLQTLTT